MFQWRANVVWPIERTLFSPDSRTYVIYTIQGADRYWWEEYSTTTGTKINEAHTQSDSPKGAQIAWAQSRGYQTGLNVLEPFGEIFYREEVVCLVPDEVKWTEQAQIGDTHLVIMSPTHGVIIMKAPQDVHSFSADFTTPEFALEDGCSTVHISSDSDSDSDS